MTTAAHLGDALARALAEAEDVPGAGRAVLSLVGPAGGWRAGVLWLDLVGDGLLRAEAVWAEDDAATGFVERSERLTFGAGDGLPGRAWLSEDAAWHEDLGQAPDFARAAEAARSRLQTAGLAPVATVAGRPLGVLEVLGDGPREQDEAALAVLATAARQLAQFVLRVRAEEGRRSAEDLRVAIVGAALDCIVTADHRGRIIDFNPAAEATFGLTRQEALGRSVGEVIVAPHLREAHERAMRSFSPERPSAVLGQRLELEGVRADGSVFPVELTVTRLGSAEPPVFAGFIRDLTERRRAEDELARLLELERSARLRAETAERATKRIADVLQRSLLPPHLPVIDGVELAATYRSGSRQTYVGGDFYDVFALAPDRWGVVIGDVRGKGPEAAAITALARYTVRTAAVRERSPSAVLRVLNDALLRDTDAEAFCTVVYATLDLGAEWPHVRLAVGGHPPPLLVRSGGEVTEPAARGSLLGVLPEPRLVEQELQMGAGDVLLLYTDGLTEARTDEGRLDVEGLREVLRTGAGMDAASLVAHVEDAAARACRFEDDVAILAVGAAGAPVTTEVASDPPREALGGSESVALSLPAEPSSVPAIRRAVVRLAQRSLGASACHRVATAATEAVSNVVVHAYRDAEPGTIEVAARLEDRELVVLIEDAGTGLRPRQGSPGLGLGLPLIRHYADEVEWSERVEGGASVQMRFRARFDEDPPEDGDADVTPGRPPA